MAIGTGQIDPGSLNQNIKSWQSPAKAPAPPVKAAPAPPQKNVGATGFWQRISQVGIGKVNALNAYRAVSHSGQGVDANNSPIKTAGKAVKSGANALVSSERAVAKPIARLLPGGQNDLKAENASIDSNNRNRQFINKQLDDGKITPAQHSKLIKMNVQQTKETGKEVAGTAKDIKETTDKGRIIAGAAGTVLDVATAGGGKLVRQAGKYAVEQGVKKGALKTAEKVALKVPGKAALPAAAAGAGVANAKASGATGKEALIQGAAGAAIPLVGAAAAKGAKFVVNKGKMVFDRPAVKTEDLVREGAASDVTKSSKIAVTDKSTGEVKGKVSGAIPEKTPTTKGSQLPSDQGYNDTDFRLQFNKGAKDFAVSPGKAGSAVAAAHLKTGSKDPLTLVVDALSATKNKSVARTAVDKLIPQADSATKNAVTREVTKAGSHQEVSDILWNAAKGHEARVETAGTPMGKKIAFEEPQAKVSQLGGKRVQNADQSAFEKAHNTGNKTAEATAAEKLRDPALRGESMSPAAKAKMIADMRAGKAPKVAAAKVGEEGNVETLTSAKPVITQEMNRKGTPTPVLKGGQKERGFNETVRTSKNTPAGTTAELAKKDGYVPQNNDALVEEANHRVSQDINEAHAFAEKDPSNRGVATGVALIHHYQGQGNYKAAADVADTLAKKLTEAGRTVQAAALYNRLSPAGIVQFANKRVGEVGKELSGEAKEAIQKMAQDIEKLPAGEAKDRATHDMLEFIGKQRGSSAGDKAISIWKAGLLSAPTTTGGNILGNTGSRLLMRATDPVSVVYDKLFSTLGKTGKLVGLVKKDSTIGNRTVVSSGKGYRGGFMEGLHNGVDYFKTGFDPRHDPSKFDYKQVYFSDTVKGKAAEKYTQGIMRLMGAQDQPFYYGSLRNAVQKQALLAAKNQGIRGSARKAFVKEFIQNPSIDAMKAANKEARYAVFQNDTVLGKLAANLKKPNIVVNGKTVNVAPFTEGIIPFSQVPASIATRIVEYTPLNAATQLVKQVASKNFDQKAMSEALGKGTVGAGVVGAGVALAKNGNLTLGYPKDPSTQAQWKAEGKTPYSVKVGNKWISMNYVQPVGALLAMGGAYQQARAEGKGGTEAWNAMLGTIANSVTSQSFLQGVSGTLNAATDPERYASKFMNSTVGSLVPNIVRSAAKSTDQYQRESKSPTDALKAGIPGVRKSLPVQTDALGKPVKRQTSAANSFLNPLKPSDAKDTRATRELDRLQYFPTAPSKTQRGKLLNAKEYNAFQTKSNQKFAAKLDRAINDHSYQALSDERKKAVLAAAVRDAREETLKESYGNKAKVKRQRLIHYR